MSLETAPRKAQNSHTIKMPMQAVLHALNVSVGDAVELGQEVALLEAMKMHHPITAPADGTIAEIRAAVGDVLDQGAILLIISATSDKLTSKIETALDTNIDAIPASLEELQQRLNKTLDAARPEAMKKRHDRGHRSARENVSDLCDDDSFSEYGQLLLAAQRSRRSLDDLIDNTPADGMVAGFGTVNAQDFGDETSRVAVLAYDYTVLAGTQGAFNHKKTDRILELACEWSIPSVFFTEGGGGRPGDTDMSKIQASSLDVMSFATYAKSSGVAPRIAINNGRCFAGNAVFFGCADVTIATKDSNIGMGGPAMIEGGGLGDYKPEDIGPADIQAANGVLDLVVDNEAEAVREAKKLLGFFQGRHASGACADQRRLRNIVPADRKRAYSMHEALKLIADSDSLMELRGGYGLGMITGFMRIDGRPFGFIANNPAHLGGAIDAEAAEKAARFMQLCDGFDIPLLSFCDTPGFMVGPEHEKQATVRRASSMMLVGASLSVPVFMIVLRKGYGLGAQAMAMGSFHVPSLTIAWPSGEFGPMGLEGAVRLGYKRELDAQVDEASRQALFDKLLASFYQSGKAISVASVHEIDAVIDPIETRSWILRGLNTYPVGKKHLKPKRPFIDSW
jgi:acetyl-CoA carboxylase carboxyltransferase component